VYHVSLDLTPRQVHQLKISALNQSMSVKGLVTALVVVHLEQLVGHVEAIEDQGKKPVSRKK